MGCPNGEFYEYHAMAIGGRSTSAKTYLERQFESLGPLSAEALIQQAVEAMNRTASETTLTPINTSVAIIGRDTKYRQLPESEVQTYLDKLEKKEEGDVAMEDAAAPST